MNDEILRTVNCIILELEQMKLTIKELEEKLKELEKNDHEQ